MMDSYTILAQSYDRLTADVGYEKWADYVERHFRKLKRPIRSVTELGCGTGSLARICSPSPSRSAGDWTFFFCARIWPSSPCRGRQTP